MKNPFHPIREDNRADEDVGIIAYDAPKQGQRCCEADGNKIAQEVGEEIFCHATAARRRADEQDHPHYQLAGIDEQMFVHRRDAHNQENNNPKTCCSGDESRKIGSEPKEYWLATHLTRGGDDVVAGLTSLWAPFTQKRQFENSEQNPFKTTRTDKYTV